MRDPLNPDPDTEHTAQCGPARGFRICYCRCGRCRDEQNRCICPGCGAWHAPPPDY